MPDVWFQRNPLMVMSYLSLHKGEEPIHGRKLAEELGLSQGSVSTILRQLESIGVVTARPVGRTLVYRAIEGHPLLKALRVFENQLILQPLVSSLKGYCRQIILFGSCATGSDDINSDIDLFVLADEPEAVREHLGDHELGRELSPAIVSPLELTLMETNERAFLEEIRKGIVLWEADNENH